MSNRVPASHLPEVVERPEVIWQRLSQSVQIETFTPFLGAGASSLRPDRLNEHPWDKVSERISLLRAYLDEKDRQYLDSMANTHRITLDRSNSGQKFCPANQQDAALFKLQLALTRLGSKVVEVFGREMLDTRQCVSEVLDYQIPLSNPDDRETILNLLFDAADAAKELCQQAACEPTGLLLESEAIYERLLVLLCRMCPQKTDNQCSKTLKRCKAHCGEINELRRVVDLTTREVLRLDELSWLADLLWHTLRYPLPVYPTTAELAFQLSLMIRVMGDPELRRGELAQIAELQANYEQQVKKIREWFEFCENENRRPSDFHLSIAAALQYQFVKNQGRNAGPLPVAFVTNYDRALEKAFEKLGLSYHVVFPLYAGWGTESVSIIWLFKTVVPPGSPVAPGPQECTGWESVEDLNSPIRGPIVIKLHGSPLEPLPAARDIGCPPELQHCIVLSESSYLAAIVGQKSYPKWIEKELVGGEPRRALWFLGYSISDWNIRLRLYEHLLHNKDSVQSRDSRPMRLAVDRRFDVLRAAVLGPLQVTIYKTDLLAFATALKRIPEVKRILEQRLR